MSHNKELSIVPLYVYNTLTNYNNIYMKFKEKINLKGDSHYYLSLSTYYINWCSHHCYILQTTLNCSQSLPSSQALMT